MVTYRVEARMYDEWRDVCLRLSIIAATNMVLKIHNGTDDPELIFYMGLSARVVRETDNTVIATLWSKR